MIRHCHIQPLPLVLEEIDENLSSGLTAFHQEDDMNIFDEWFHPNNKLDLISKGNAALKVITFDSCTWLAINYIDAKVISSFTNSWNPKLLCAALSDQKNWIISEN